MAVYADLIELSVHFTLPAVDWSDSGTHFILEFFLLKVVTIPCLILSNVAVEYAAQSFFEKSL